MKNRIDSGRPTINFKDRQVVSADAIALLSGVNFGSVEKMLAAIYALHRFTGTDVEELVRLSDAPLHRVVLDDYRDTVRAKNTLALVFAVVDSSVAVEVEDIIKVRSRFGRG